MPKHRKEEETIAQSMTQELPLPQSKDSKDLMSTREALTGKWENRIISVKDVCGCTVDKLKNTKKGVTD